MSELQGLSENEKKKTMQIEKIVCPFLKNERKTESVKP